MTPVTLLPLLPLLASAAATDPLSEALRNGGGTLCFTRAYEPSWLKAHPGQTVREVKLAISDRSTMRMSLKGAGRAYYAFGSCSWMQGNLNRGVANTILVPTFRPTTGIGCHMVTDVSGASAEEGGDFPVAWLDGGRRIEIHLEQVAAWRSFNVRRHADFFDLHSADRILRLERADPSACRELLTRFAAGVRV